MKPISVSVLCALGFGLLGWAGTNHSRTSYYCQTCGMSRSQNERQWFGIPYQETNRLYQTGYSELYFRATSAPCQHKWVFTGGHSSGLQGGAIACGASPYALRYSPLLRRLRNLDKTKVPAVLAVFPLQPFTRETAGKRMDETFEALTDLDESSTTQETELWWKKHHKLFKP